MIVNGSDPVVAATVELHAAVRAVPTRPAPEPPVASTLVDSGEANAARSNSGNNGSSSNRSRSRRGRSLNRRNNNNSNINGNSAAEQARRERDQRLITAGARLGIDMSRIIAARNRDNSAGNSNGAGSDGDDGESSEAENESTTAALAQSVRTALWQLQYEATASDRVGHSVNAAQSFRRGPLPASSPLGGETPFANSTWTARGNGVLDAPPLYATLPPEDPLGAAQRYQNWYVRRMDTYFNRNLLSNVNANTFFIEFVCNSSIAYCIFC